MDQKRRIRWGILGTLWISETMAAAIKESNTSELVAIGSRDINKAKAFADKFSITNYYDNYDALLRDRNVDVVYLGIPNHLHKEWIERCALAGKHILCEKPLVLSSSEAKSALAVVEQCGVFCMEGLMYLHHPLIKKYQSLIDEKVIGDIQFITATYAANIAALANPTSGGAIRNLGCYPLSLIRLLLKQEPTSVIGRVRKNGDGSNDNISMLTLSFENGVMASIVASDISQFQWQFEIIGSKGTIRAKSNPWCPDKSSELLIIRDGKEQIVTVTADKPLFTYQVDVLGNHVRAGLHKPDMNAVTWEHSMGNVAILDEWLSH